MNWQLENIPNVCQSDQEQNFTCVNTYSFFTSSLIWGTVGPGRMYGATGLYSKAFYAFLFGAIVPIPFYLLSRFGFPKFRHIYTPLMLSGGIAWAPTNMSWLIPPLYIGYIFHIYIRRRYPQWWATYNVPSPFSFCWHWSTSHLMPLPPDQL